MLFYATVGTNRPDEAIPFFTELFATQGIVKVMNHPKGVIFGKGDKLVLGVLAPWDGQPASAGNGTMLTLDMPTREAVDAFHAKAIELGAQDEGAPGLRGDGFYMAYFRDFDGNKFCACRIDKWR